MISNVNKGTINGEIVEIVKEFIPLQNDRSMIKYLVILERTTERKGTIRKKLAAIEYTRFTPSQLIESLKTGGYVRCDFEIESRKWESADKIRYFTTAKGIGEVCTEDRPKQLELDLAHDDIPSDIPF